jgi:hypothetical protein
MKRGTTSPARTRAEVMVMHSLAGSPWALDRNQLTMRTALNMEQICYACRMLCKAGKIERMQVSGGKLLCFRIVGSGKSAPPAGEPQDPSARMLWNNEIEEFTRRVLGRVTLAWVEM